MFEFNAESLLNPLIYLFAFFLGSIPFGLIVARIFNVKDLTAHGSGNIGATNVSRVIGIWPAGVLTFALDVSKGALPVLLVASAAVRGVWLHGYFSLAGVSDSLILNDGFSDTVIWAVGFFTVLGHCYSPWLRFRGGKGVSTGLGVLLVLSPVAAFAGVIAFGVMFLLRRISSLASLTALAIATVAHLVINGADPHLWMGAAMVFLILLRHETNINALLEDREASFGP